MSRLLFYLANTEWMENELGLNVGSYFLWLTLNGRRMSWDSKSTLILSGWHWMDGEWVETQCRLLLYFIWLTLNGGRRSWDSMSTESTLNETLFQQGQHRVRLRIVWINMKLIKYFLNCQKMPIYTKLLSYCVDSVDVESHFVSTQLTRNYRNLE
jgi:hypothetical protein